jgi:DNA-binding CsgD family transcriptional regulator
MLRKVRYRPCRVRDLDACEKLVSQRVGVPSVDLRGIWQSWLNKQATMFVVEDPERPARGILCFVASVFVRESFLSGADSWLERLYNSAGTPSSPVLTLPEIRSANARRDLHLVLLHLAMRDIDGASAQHALHVANAGIYFFLDGYGLKSMHLETAEPALAAQARAAGLRSRPGSAPPLFGITRQELAPALAFTLPSLFFPRAPRFDLTPAQQQVLLYALLGNGDVETAEELGVSLDAIKQAWRGIHQRVERVAPLLVERRTEANGVRGGERRRRLIEYLRLHAEELRPIARTAATARHNGSACA